MDSDRASSAQCASRPQVFAILGQLDKVGQGNESVEKHMTPQTLSDSNLQPMGKGVLQGDPSLRRIQRESNDLGSHS